MIEKVTLYRTEDGRLQLAGDIGYEALNPKALLLCAAAKCAALTALAILDKARVKPSDFRITFSGELSTDTVQAESMYRSFHVAFHVECAPGQQQRVSRALLLTIGRHCSLIAMLRSIAPVSHEIAIVATEAVEA